MLNLNTAKEVIQLRYRILVILLLLFISHPIFDPVHAFADAKEIISEGTYNMGDGETPSAAEMRALEQAKRISIEQAGTYVQSYSRSKNYQLTDDEIITIASGVMQVTILEKQRFIIGDGFKFWVKIKAVITTDNIELIAKRLKADPTIDKYGYQEMDNNRQNVTILKRQLSSAENIEGRDNIRNQIAYSERMFNATTLFEEGNKSKMIGEYEQAIDYYTQAIALNNNYAKAYLNRGQAYMILNQYHFAQEDLQTTLQLNPNLFLAHWYLGCIYDRKGFDRQAIEEYRSFVAVATREYSSNIETAYRRIDEYERYSNISYNNPNNYGHQNYEQRFPLKVILRNHRR